MGEEEKVEEEEEEEEEKNKTNKESSMEGILQNKHANDRTKEK